MKLIKDFKHFLFEAKRGNPGVDWDTYLVLFPYTKDDHDFFLSASSKRNKERKESLTDLERFAENKYMAASRRNLIPEEFKIQIDWDTYFKETPYTQDDHKRYLASASKRKKEGKESLTDPERFAVNKYMAAAKRNLVPEKFKIQIDWDTYFKENPFTPEDRKRSNFAKLKRDKEGSEALTDEDRFAINKYIAHLRKRELKKDI